MLEYLSQNHKTWYSYALKICGDEELSKDLVQDMYVKLHDKDKLTKSYIYDTIKSIFIDHVRKEQKQKNISIEDVYYLEAESIDYDKKHLSECLQKLKWFDREVLIATHTNSLRKAEALTGVYYGVLHYHKVKALKKLKKLYHGRTKG